MKRQRTYTDVSNLEPFKKGDLCIVSIYYGTIMCDTQGKKVGELLKNSYCIYLGEIRIQDKRTGLRKIKHTFIASGNIVCIEPTALSRVKTFDDDNSECD
jgi:hypothetical protein